MRMSKDIPEALEAGIKAYAHDKGDYGMWQCCTLATSVFLHKVCA